MKTSLRDWLTVVVVSGATLAVGASVCYGAYVYAVMINGALNAFTNL